MIYRDRLKIKKDIEETTNEIIEYLEEDRFYPLGKEAGTAAADAAYSNVQDSIYSLINYLTDKYDLDCDSLIRKYTIKEIIEECTKHTYTLAELCGFEELTQHDCPEAEDDTLVFFNYDSSEDFIRVELKNGVTTKIDHVREEFKSREIRSIYNILDVDPAEQVEWVVVV